MRVFIITSLLCVLALGLAHKAHAQGAKPDNTYSFRKLSQEMVKITKSPMANGVKISGDTTYTLYKNSSVNMMLYFVNGEQYNPLFNPNPTGIVLNNVSFNFFCDVERAFRLNASDFLDIYEFNYLGRNYLALVTLREDCVAKQCQFKCYNLFDITDPKRIAQTSFSSIFRGSDSFGDFNMDGKMDFVRAVPKLPENAPPGTKLTNETYLVTAYTFGHDRTVQLKNDQGSANYIFAKGDQEANQFKVMQHDWMIPLKDSTGNVAKSVNYFQSYVAFDPKDAYLYDAKGTRIEKNRWSLVVSSFTDLEGAQKFCEELISRKFNNIFIMTDQYSREISFIVLVGNYLSKEQAKAEVDRLKALGFDVKMRDLKSAY